MDAEILLHGHSAKLLAAGNPQTSGLSQAMERQHTQTHPVPSCGIQLRGQQQREDEFGEAAIVAKQQLQLQGTLGSSPIISTLIKPSTELLLLLFTCCQWQQGASRTSSPVPKQGLYCSKSNITTRRTWVLVWVAFLENVVTSPTCYLSKGRKQMREAVKNFTLEQ